MSTTAQIIDHHRQDGRSVGYGVTVQCACGAGFWGYIDGDQAIDGENNSHRYADRKHAQHVADVLAAQEPTDAEVEATADVLEQMDGMDLEVVARAALSAARTARGENR